MLLKSVMDKPPTAVRPVTTRLRSFFRISDSGLFNRLKKNPIKATYLDNEAEKFLQDAAEVITPRLTRVINLHIKSADE